MATKKRNVYLKGLGDLYLKVSQPDNPALQVDDNESVTGWAGIATGSVALSQVQVLEGTYALRVSVGSANDGAEKTLTAADYSDWENGVFLANIYADAGFTLKVKFEETTHSETFNYTVVAGWNRVLINLSRTPDASSGTVDWSAIDTIGFINSSTTDDFYIDGVYFFDTLADTEREDSVRVACINEIGLDTSDDSVELRCSRNEVVETEITSTEITLSATVKDFDPTGMAVVSAGSVSTSGVTKLVEGESFTVPASGPFTYTLDQASNLKIGDGYGVWIRKADSAEVLQETPDSTIVTSGYYYVNPSTGVITFNAAEAGVDMIVDYNVTVSQGRTLTVLSDRSFLEFSLQFQVKGSNNKTALMFFPRLKSSSFGLEPALDDFWSYNFEARVLADASGKYYDFHVAD